MTPKMAAERKSPARYWPHSRRDTPPSNAEVLRAKLLAHERLGLTLTQALCGDPGPSRRQTLHLQRDAQGCYVPGDEEHD